MRILFCDIDGVLAFGKETWGGNNIVVSDMEEIVIPYEWKPTECAALRDIIEETECKIVISSDWKLHYTLDQMRIIFEFFGIPNVIIGETHSMKEKMSSNLESDRAKQIADWLSEHKNDVESWVAIDDLMLGVYYPDQNLERERHVYIDGWEGVKLSNNIEKVIYQLNKKWNVE